MDAIKTIDTLKPYTQRRLYFRFGRRKSSISLSSAGHHQFYLHKLVFVILFTCKGVKKFNPWEYENNLLDALALLNSVLIGNVVLQKQIVIMQQICLQSTAEKV
ncbi:uncharacterized protein LOC113282008 isoform X1 [Papaver somniferum]|uniref:uncharacterized protein LOC113282008 isoform X1 n=1 Tax=Papaver somniferum TaxID=3469 RepID=UPI000E6FCD52|nr:uncharacterized protein LOC113282008 isoform X1 [Papaver somniferum]